MIYDLRPHHGMCLAFFQGKGYSSTFTQHMAQIQTELAENPQIRLVEGLDVICEACPNHADGICADQQKVSSYDAQVLRRCQLQAGAVMPYRTFEKTVYDCILLTRQQKRICGSCQWSQLCHLRE